MVEFLDMIDRYLQEYGFTLKLYDKNCQERRLSVSLYTCTDMCMHLTLFVSICMCVHLHVCACGTWVCVVRGH